MRARPAASIRRRQGTLPWPANTSHPRQPAVCPCNQPTREATGKLPDALLVYRDGVSDSQLGTVVDREVGPMRRVRRWWLVGWPHMVFLAYHLALYAKTTCCCKCMVGIYTERAPHLIVTTHLTSKHGGPAFKYIFPTVAAGRPTIQACAAVGGPSYAPPLTLLVVSKSHGLRMMAVTGEAGAGGERLPEVDNPLPGSVLDHTVTRWVYARAPHVFVCVCVCVCGGGGVRPNCRGWALGHAQAPGFRRAPPGLLYCVRLLETSLFLLPGCTVNNELPTRSSSRLRLGTRPPPDQPHPLALAPWPNRPQGPWRMSSTWHPTPPFRERHAPASARTSLSAQRTPLFALLPAVAWPLLAPPLPLCRPGVLDGCLIGGVGVAFAELAFERCSPESSGPLHASLVS
jgi:hypothetical protein